MKKLSTIFLALVLALVAAACNANSTSCKGNSSATAQETLTIKHQLGELRERVAFSQLDTLDSLDSEPGQHRMELDTWNRHHEARGVHKLDQA